MGGSLGKKKDQTKGKDQIVNNVFGVGGKNTAVGEIRKGIRSSAATQREEKEVVKKVENIGRKGSGDSFFLFDHGGKRDTCHYPSPHREELRRPVGATCTRGSGLEPATNSKVGIHTPNMISTPKNQDMVQKTKQLGDPGRSLSTRGSGLEPATNSKVGIHTPNMMTTKNQDMVQKTKQLGDPGRSLSTRGSGLEPATNSKVGIHTPNMISTPKNQDMVQKTKQLGDPGRSLSTRGSGLEPATNSKVGIHTPNMMTTKNQDMVQKTKQLGDPGRSLSTRGSGLEPATNSKVGIHTPNMMTTKNQDMVQKTKQLGDPGRSLSTRGSGLEPATNSIIGIHTPNMISTPKNQDMVQKTKQLGDPGRSLSTRGSGLEPATNSKVGIHTPNMMTTKNQDMVQKTKQLGDPGRSLSTRGSGLEPATNSKVGIHTPNMMTTKNQDMVQKTKQLGDPGRSLSTRGSGLEPATNSKVGIHTPNMISTTKNQDMVQKTKQLGDPGRSLSSTMHKSRGSGNNLKSKSQPLHMTTENQDMLREMLHSLETVVEDHSFSYDEMSTEDDDDDEGEFDEDDQMSKSHSNFASRLDMSSSNSRGAFPKKEARLTQVSTRSYHMDNFRKKQYQKMQSIRQRLPAWKKKELVVEKVKNHQVVVICGMTGCGKTTQVPQYLLDDALEDRNVDINIVCTQPRKISAMSVAQRVADERAEPLGRTVGYQIRLESAKSSSTRLLFCTMGIILRRLENDPYLVGITHIIIDEVHERNAESDYLLMILRHLLKGRPELKVILMSATVNTELFSSYFGGCPVLDIPGQSYQVDQYFLEDVIQYTKYVLEEGSEYCRQKRYGNARSQQKHNPSGNISQTPDDNIPDMKLDVKQLRQRYSDYSPTSVKTLSMIDVEKINYDLILHLLEWIATDKNEFPPGAIMVFLPGFAEIETLYGMLMASSEFGTRNKAKYKIFPLHSSLSCEEQNSVFETMEEGVTKIVIATNIAETSITIDDIFYIVDAGRMKEKRYDQTKNIDSLETVWVSRANAEQRKGRAGRVKNGVCFHLFTYYHFHCHLRAHPVPEVQRTCLEQLVLRTKMLPFFCYQDSESVLGQLIEPPTPAAIQGATKRLTDLGALDGNEELTPLGYHVGSLPVDVRIGKLMLYGAIFGCLDTALTVGACLSLKSPFESPFLLKKEADQKKQEFAMCNSDYLAMLNAYKGWTEAKKTGSYRAYLYCKENFLSAKTLQDLARLKQQYVELLSEIKFIRPGIRVKHVEGAARKGSDGVVEITGTEANANIDNWSLMSGLLVAALYPNMIKVLRSHPEHHATQAEAGAEECNCKAKDLGFITKFDGHVSIHPSSTNFKVCHYPSPYLVYHEKIKTKKLYIRNSSMVSEYPVLLFCGGKMSYDGNTISVDDGWIEFIAISPQVADLVRRLREKKDKLLSDKMSNPKKDLMACPRASKVINCIVKLVSRE